MENSNKCNYKKSFVVQYLCSHNIPQNISIELVNSISKNTYIDLFSITSEDDCEQLFNHLIYIESIDILDIVVSLEKIFGITVTEKETREINSFIDLAQLVLAKVSIQQ